MEMKIIFLIFIFHFEQVFGLSCFCGGFPCDVIFGPFLKEMT